MNGYIQIHEINHSFHVEMFLGNYQFPFVVVCSDIFLKG